MRASLVGTLHTLLNVRVALFELCIVHDPTEIALLLQRPGQCTKLVKGETHVPHAEQSPAGDAVQSAAEQVYVRQDVEGHGGQQTQDNPFCDDGLV